MIQNQLWLDLVLMNSQLVGLMIDLCVDYEYQIH